MPTRHRTDRLLTRKALRNDRGLDLRWPIPPLAPASENLEALNPAGASIIIWHRHSTSFLTRNQGADTRRCTALPQGGVATPLTKGASIKAIVRATGYPWTIIPVERRAQYMMALEAASGHQDILPFTDFLADLLRSELRGKTIAHLPDSA